MHEKALKKIGRFYTKNGEVFIYGEYLTYIPKNSDAYWFKSNLLCMGVWVRYTFKMRVLDLLLKLVLWIGTPGFKNSPNLQFISSEKDVDLTTLQLPSNVEL
jgi:hypothetical protein